MANIEEIHFKDIDLNDNFFESLKKDYQEFSNWFSRKSNQNASSFVLYEDRKLMAFLYLKIEDDIDENIFPPFEHKKRLKIGTFKIDGHGTKLGERFIKKIFDVAISKNINEIYVTIFLKHKHLINLLMTFGFFKYGTKKTHDGEEMVLIKNFFNLEHNILKDYPMVPIKNKCKFVLSIYPYFHTSLFSDSILHNESVDILDDVSYTNSIRKIYICAMKGVLNFTRGDIILIYRTKDAYGPARYRSVVTSICVVEEVLNINSFATYEDFLKYCEPYSIFSENELSSFYNVKKYPYIIKMTYNVAFKKKVTNGYLVDMLKIRPDYWGVFSISDEQFSQIIKAGEVNESIIVN